MAGRRPHDPDAFARELAQLSKMGKTALWRRYEEVFGTKARCCHPRTLRVQIARKLASTPARPAPSARSATTQAVAAPQALRGTLVKEYRGERHEVVVIAGGFEYRGQKFRSLSALARAITGTTWNGLRFFAVTRAAEDVA
jgi:hypothetical protein